MKCEFQYTQRLEDPSFAGLPEEPNGKWYFWSETWCDAYGPYESEAEASAGAAKYAIEVLGV